MAATDLPSVSGARSFEEPEKKQDPGNKLFLSALISGLILRLGVAIFGDVGVYTDGASRIALAVVWAEKPSWQGLSGVWPPLHVYLLGSLISIWNHPILLAKVLTLAFSVGTIFVFRAAVRHSFNNLVAGMATLMLAISWTHIWLTSSYWVEVPYLFFIILAVCFEHRSIATGKTLDLHIAGCSFGVGILLRNDGFLIAPLALVWYALRTRDWRRTLLLAWVPMLVATWCLLEPMLEGHSFLDYFKYAADMKATENLLQSLSVGDCLWQWALMLGASPTIMIVLPGIFELYRRRQRIPMDLFAWMFIVEFAFYFVTTIALGWRPQMRYLLLCVVNLLPYAALGWNRIIEFFSTRYALAGLLAVTVSIQSLGWWAGRNHMRAYGWLPVQVVTSSQKKLDMWVTLLKSRGLSELRVVSVVPSAVDERWSLVHSALLNDVRLLSSTLEEVHVQVDRDILSGQLPERVRTADIILIDPRTVFYPTVLEALKQISPEATIDQMHPDIAVLLVSARARDLAEQIAELH